jgi:hypothetical protein
MHPATRRHDAGCVGLAMRCRIVGQRATVRCVGALKPRRSTCVDETNRGSKRSRKGYAPASLDAACALLVGASDTRVAGTDLPRDLEDPWCVEPA